MDMSYMVAFNPFVKHADTVKSGKFVLYNRLRLVSTAIVGSVVAVALLLATLLLKPSYTAAESSFLAIGWVCVAVYFLSSLVLYSAYPKYKRVVTNSKQDIIRRSVFTACIAVAAISINVLAGLSAINASDFLVFWVVPCVVGSAFILEGLTIFALKKRPFFLT